MEEQSNLPILSLSNNSNIMVNERIKLDLPALNFFNEMSQISTRNVQIKILQNEELLIKNKTSFSCIEGKDEIIYLIPLNLTQRIVEDEKSSILSQPRLFNHQKLNN